MSVVCTASGVPSAMIPRQSLVCGDSAVSQLADECVDADLSAAGMVGIPMIAVLVLAKQTIIGTHITLEVRVISTCGMNHDAFDRDFSACLVAGVFRKNKFA